MRRGAGRVGESIGPTSRWVTVGALRRAGVEMLTEVAYERIEPGAVHIRDAGGAAREIAAEAVIVCAGQEPDRGLADRLAALGVPHLVIGGAAQAAELDAERAFRDGAETPARVAALLSSEPASSVSIIRSLADVARRCDRRLHVERAPHRELG